MKFKGIAATLALSAALALGMAVPAFAAEIDGVTTTPTVTKNLELNTGSTVTATFEFEIANETIPVGNGTDTLEGPALKIANAAFENATAGVDPVSSAITLADGSAITASAFSNAGYYGYKITEKTGTYQGSGEMQYNTDAKTYYLVIAVDNDGGVKYYAYDTKPTTLTDEGNKKVEALEFTNKFTETTTDNDTDLVISKTVTGNQGDKTKKFDFTVTFTADDSLVLPAGKTAEDVLNAITATADGATDLTPADASGTTRTFTFKAADSESVTFADVLAGITYTVVETQVDGYEQSYAAVANGESSTATTDLLVGEKTNTGEMTNEYQDITVTGLVLDNAPFIIMGLVAVAGVVLYGAARRKLTA